MANEAVHALSADLIALLLYWLMGVGIVFAFLVVAVLVGRALRRNQRHYPPPESKP